MATVFLEIVFNRVIPKHSFGFPSDWLVWLNSYITS